MNVNLFLLGVALATIQVVIPRSLFFAPLVAATFLAPKYPFLYELNCQRLVIIIAIARLLATRPLGAQIVRADKIIVTACALILLSSAFHLPDPTTRSPFLFRLRLIFDILSIYLYSRTALRNLDDFVALCRSFVIVTPLLAIPLMAERVSGQNPFSILGARLETSLVRDGSIRACGPFGTPILAGTAGALTIPFTTFFFAYRPLQSVIGTAAGLIVVFASSSSGPVGTTAIACGWIVLWRFRQHWRRAIYIGIAATILLFLAMERPPWYILSMIDIVGGSTGWHRAKLIDAAFDNLSSWIMWGTDYTKDWMPYSLPTVPNHVDLTNYYIHIGVIAGLPAALLIIWALLHSLLGSVKASVAAIDTNSSRALWHIGACLAAIIITGFTISFYDQGYIFPYVAIAASAGCINYSTTSAYSAAVDSATQRQ